MLPAPHSCCNRRHHAPGLVQGPPPPGAGPQKREGPWPQLLLPLAHGHCRPDSPPSPMTGVAEAQVARSAHVLQHVAGQLQLRWNSQHSTTQDAATRQDPPPPTQSERGALAAAGVHDYMGSWAKWRQLRWQEHQCQGTTTQQAHWSRAACLDVGTGLFTLSSATLGD